MHVRRVISESSTWWAFDASRYENAIWQQRGPSAPATRRCRPRDDEPSLALGAYRWIRRATEGRTKHECRAFLAERLDLLAEPAYALGLYRRRGGAPLDHWQEFVTFRCTHAASDPEVYGILDVTAIRVVSMIEDGGA